MSASYRLAQLKEKRRKKAALQSDNRETDADVFPLSPDMGTVKYINAFNTYVTKLKGSEYQTKNPELFCWNQTPKYLGKLALPPHLTHIPSLQSVSSRNLPDTSRHETIPEETILNKKPSNPFTKSSSTRSLKKEGTSKVEIVKNVKPSTSPLKKKLELDLDELENIYRGSPLHAKTTYPITKVQTELLTNRSDPASLGVPNSQYMLNHFNKRNYSVNKIVSQINANEKLLSKDEIVKETIAKIGYISKLHKPIKKTRPKTYAGDQNLVTNSARTYLATLTDDATERLKTTEGELMNRQTSQRKGAVNAFDLELVRRQSSQKKGIVDERRKASAFEIEPVYRQSSQKKGVVDERRGSAMEGEPVIRQTTQKKWIDERRGSAFEGEPMYRQTSQKKGSVFEIGQVYKQTTQKNGLVEERRGSTLEGEPIYRQASQKKGANARRESSVYDWDSVRQSPQRNRTERNSILEGESLIRQISQKRVSTHEGEAVIRQITQKRGFDLNLQQALFSLEEEVKGKPSVISFRTPKEARNAAINLKKRGSELRMNVKKDSNLVRNVKVGIQKLEEFSSQREYTRDDTGMMSSTPEEESVPYKSFMQFVRTTSMTWKAKTAEEEAMMKVTQVRVKNDNIFNYKNYFKKKYLEKGMNMEVSPELKSRIKSFGKDIKSSIGKMKEMSENKE